MRNLVLHVVKPLSLDPKWNEIVDRLDSEKFDERESATEWLIANASNRMGEILSTYFRPGLSSEVANRLRRVLKVILPPADFASLEFVSEKCLAEDAEYLVWLAEELQAGNELPP